MYHLLFGQHVEAESRLIQKYDGGVVQQHPNVCPHTLAQAQFPGKGAQDVFQIEQFCHQGKVLFIYILRDAPHLFFPFKAGNDGMIPPQLCSLSKQYTDMAHQLNSVSDRA